MEQPSFVTVVSVDGVKLRVAVAGQGPLCLLVHGWPECWYSWRHQIPALVEAGYRVAALDTRGSGGSDKPAEREAYRMEALVADIGAVMDQLDAEQCWLIGHDWGAPIVWTTTLAMPTRVRGVAGLSVPYLGPSARPLIETIKHHYRGRFFYQLYFQEPGRAEAELDQDVRRSLQLLYYEASAAGHHSGVRLQQDDQRERMFEGLEGPAPEVPFMDEEELAYYVSQFEPTGFGPSLMRYRVSELDWAWTHTLSAVQIGPPALFIAGQHDQVLDFVPGVRLENLMDPHYQDLRGKHLLPEAGHWVQQEQPQAVNRLLLSFLDQTGASPAD